MIKRQHVFKESSSQTFNLIKLSFFQLCFELIYQNPLSKNIYIAMLLIETTLLLIIPVYALVNYSGLLQLSNQMIQSSSTTLMICLQLPVIVFQLLILSLFVVLLIRSRISQQKSAQLSLNSNRLANCPIQVKLLTILIISGQTFLQYPLLIIIFRTYLSYMEEHEAAIETYLTFLISLALIIQLKFYFVFQNFMTTPFQLRQVPWSRPISQIVSFAHFQKYLLAFGYAFPLDSPHAPIPYALTLAFSLICLIFSMNQINSYDRTIKNILFLQQAFILISSLSQFIITVHFDQDLHTSLLCGYVIIGISLLFTIKFLNKYLVDRAAIQSQIKNISSAKHTIYALLQIFQNYYSSSGHQIQDAILFFKTVGLKHKASCFKEECVCKTEQFRNSILKIKTLRKKDKDSVKINKVKKFQKKVHQMLVFLIEVTITEVDSPNLSKTQKDQLEQLHLILVFQKHHFLEMLYSTYFELLKVHDCVSSSSVMNCYLQFQLRSVINKSQEVHNHHHQKENIELNFDQTVAYENLHRSYCSKIEDLSQDVLSYWSHIMKSEFGLQDISKFAENILQKSRQVNEIEQKIKTQCGDTVTINLLTYKLYRDVLNFEVEAVEKLENLRNLLNKNKISKRNNQKEEFNGNSQALIVISCNPSKFQDIVLVNKQFQLISDYKEADLLNNSLSLIIPSVIEEAHERYVFNYLQRPHTIKEHKETRNVFIKNKNGTIQLVNIQIVPKITFQDGILLIGIISPSAVFHFCDKDVPADDLFIILTDTKDKIMNFSHNCMAYLNFPKNLMNKDVHLSELVPELYDDESELLNEETGAYLDLDLRQLMKYIMDEKENSKAIVFSSNKIQIQMHCQRLGDSGSPYNQYTFARIINQESLLGDDYVPYQTGLAPTMSRQDNQQTLQYAEENVSKTDYMIQSYSVSSGSSSNTESTDYKEIIDIKSPIEFKSLTPSLKRFRFQLILGFFVLTLACATLLIVNNKAKNQFLQEVNAVRNEKRIRAALSTSSLPILMNHCFSNFPSDSIKSSLYKNIDMTIISNQNILSFFNTPLLQNAQFLHDELSTFSNAQSQWSTDFVQKFKIDKIMVQSVAQNGELLNGSDTFFNGMQQFLNSANSILKTNTSLLSKNTNIFELNTQSRYTQAIKNQTSSSMLQLFQDVYFSIQNGAISFHEQMNYINNQFMDSVASNGKSVIKGLLIFTIVCGVVVILLISLIIPFLLSMDVIQLKSIELSLYIDQKVIVNQLKLINDYISYIHNNKYLQIRPMETMTTSQSTLIFNKMMMMNRATEQTKIINSPLDQKKVEESKVEGESKQFLQFTSTATASDLCLTQSEATMKNYQQYKKIKEKQKESQFKRSASKKKKSHSGSNSSDEEEKEEDREEIESTEKEKKTQQQLELISQKDNIKNINKQKLRSRTLIVKIQKVVMIYVYGSVICAFFFLGYVLSQSILNNFQGGFQEFEVFYTRTPCVADSFFYLQYAFLKNESLAEGSVIGDLLQSVVDDCQTNENNYNYIKFRGNGIFVDMINQMQILDNSTQVCDWLKRQNLYSANCTTVLGGFLTQQSMSQVQTFLNIVQKKRLLYEAVPPSQRNSTFNAQMLYDPNTINYIFVYYQYITEIYRTFQDLAYSSFIDKINSDFKKIVTTFTTFIIAQILIQVFLQKKVIMALKQKLLRIKILLKLIPSSEIILLKAKLGEVSLKNF